MLVLRHFVGNPPQQQERPSPIIGDRFVCFDGEFDTVAA
ncbi:hypothetical protein D187_004900 [Cystobacter fuscus DSM 2262]|uniref:Uncharacterized protein n=1 Tax=Cystobacter fuscus (strain ATCC 25194 / DSM 2262 / NBRC 100088 / M29) TaxID=1242864 RepID=S9QM66_CYSF2|nr:hypothetical protein D187_004900 [Cystobacter fuscus DSM 2262]